ncbi:hypothetical protein J31TS6_22870 [Brevibacillus reuszeri]|uniref:hypothetical protein n=1 Tax=Brevibacillus reuszeri TaxID=54915 RepID=UPI001B1E9470|nr:hypothetical protein [Brevibacillus reuszeri]GIO06259.1 hypothetical protein J31TS6_22870 [Brevibacillus reuszeri]
MQKDWNKLAQEAHEKHFFQDVVVASQYPGGLKEMQKYRDRLRLNRQFYEVKEVKKA